MLVAEDNEINALLMRSLLTRLGHHAVIATNGEAALESWFAAKSRRHALRSRADGHPDATELDGIETAKRIRASEAGEPGRRTPILALTANTLVEDRYACFEAGMDGFLIKPLDREKLAEALAGLAAATSRGLNQQRCQHRPCEPGSHHPLRHSGEDDFPLTREDQRMGASVRRDDVALFDSTSAYNRRSATVSMTWSAPFFRIRVARGRVGRMLSSRLARLVRSQIAVAVAIASSSDSSA